MPIAGKRSLRTIGILRLRQHFAARARLALARHITDVTGRQN